ncbi:SIR2 family protein [Yersinia enterocolitica]|uniref:SIR2 family protein n=1 Tax=Yersinia TaxID=629 RepID=UPI000BF228AA|nr:MULTISPECIES: SIR2 family protein [Yersinia]EKN6389353.1 SIR2 family protein [Yersinia enterocolitica]ELY5218888.1 SIR2 family protein [Yersinia enterocolitica]PEH54394.1 SIR2 family protein [Yersinia kristensenii]PNK74979.1 SIR2 family protein [Yersinia enterocolitica]HEI6828582.1 SIR2 family protein [Yersinia enterocolitica]
MINSDTEEEFEQFQELLNCPEQNWLLGAGISYNAKIPLMYPLTNRVVELLNDSPDVLKLVNVLKAQLPQDVHIEHILSQLGDYSAIASRSVTKEISIGNTIFTLDQIESAHNEILNNIADTIRYGYVEGEKREVGDKDNFIVRIDDHFNFIKTLFYNLRAGINERRKPVRLFTTNYDTLLEDALSLNKIPYWDGFSGGAVAYRNYRYGQSEPVSEAKAYVVKMHGSIDWYQNDDGYLWRVRDRDTYPQKNHRVLIYPQSTKYVATQKDPFSSQFDLFRKAISSPSYNVLIVCGYSFGDEHINQEISLSMSNPDSKTVLLAFCQEINGGIPDVLNTWRKEVWGKRIYIATQEGLYVSDKPVLKRKEKYDDWWTFSGITTVMKEGVI